MSGVRAAEVVLPCTDLAETLAFFTERLGFRLELVLPADDPAIAVVAGHGLRLRLERGADVAPGVLRLSVDDPAGFAAGEHALVAPNGTRVELVAADPALELPRLRPERVVARERGARWKAGRAGMRYRDLLPGHLGGRFGASLVQVPGGGPVPDYVHHHRVHFQLIYCRRGRVRVVYEDQGEPFWLAPGDAVLQPPGIRHRVLETAVDLEVIEVDSPAVHETRVDHELVLPTPAVRPERRFEGQRFVRHVAAEAAWQPWRVASLEARDLGIGDGTGGLAGARVVRAAGAVEASNWSHAGELLFHFVLAGSVTLEHGEGELALEEGDACTLPAGEYRWHDASPDLEVLEVETPLQRGISTSV